MNIARKRRSRGVNRYFPVVNVRIVGAIKAGNDQVNASPQGEVIHVQKTPSPWSGEMKQCMIPILWAIYRSQTVGSIMRSMNGTLMN